MSEKSRKRPKSKDDGTKGQKGQKEGKQLSKAQDPKPPKQKSGRQVTSGVEWQVDEAILGRMEQYSGRGLEKQHIAALFKISERTLQRHMKKNIDLAVAYARGEAVAISNVAAKLYLKATEQDNLAAQMFFLKTRARKTYGDRVEHEISGPDGGPIEQKWEIEIIDSTKPAPPIIDVTPEDEDDLLE